MKEKDTKYDHACRFCNASLTHVFVDLGKMPLANSFLKSDEFKLEKSYPLRAFVCNKCMLVQLEEFVSPEKLFSNYAYFSSYSETWLKHAENYVNMMITRFGLQRNVQVIEIASNDGYLLQYFKKENIPVLGVEPAINIAKVAEQKGIPTLKKFFGVKTAKELISKGKRADLLLGNNVLAHVPDLNDFVEGMKILLKPNGIITMEFPHLLQLIKQNQFDTIYHEHFFYFSLLVVEKIFSSHSLTIFDVEELPSHGGSLRIYARHSEKESYVVNQNVKSLLKKEKEFGLTDISTYENFSQKVDAIKQELRNFVIIAKNKRKKIICYGAPAKGSTLLNYCEIGTDFIDYTVDLSPHKQGLYLPHTHIPIKVPEMIRETKPDYILILPWNLKDEIMKQLSYVHNWGARFVVSIPKVKILC